MFRPLAGLALALVVSLSPPAVAQVRVDYLLNNNWTNLAQYPDGSSVTITDAGSRTYRVYTLNPGIQSIGNITLVSQLGATPVLFVGTGLTTPNDLTTLPTAGSFNVGAIRADGGRPSLQVRVNGNVTGDVNFWRIHRIDADASILGNVIHQPAGVPNPPRLGAITAGYIGSPTGVPRTISAKPGSIHLVHARYNLYSDVECYGGSIGTVQAGTVVAADGIIASTRIIARDGSIGDVIAYASIGHGAQGGTAVRIEARNGIHLVQGHEYVNAHVVANYGNTTGTITRLEVHPGLSLWGDFRGSLTAHSALGEPNYHAIYVENNFDGDVVLASSFSDSIFIGGAFPAGRTISIGGSLSPAASIQIGSLADACLSGQIIINSANIGGSWSPQAPIIACATETLLSPIPHYTQRSASFGGGSVAEAPFNIHASDCTPAHNSSTPVGVFPTTVVLRHYGPVFSIGSGPSLVVQARPIEAATTWADFTNDFSITFAPGNNLRNIAIIQKEGASVGFAPGYEYRITPITSLSHPDALRCLMVTGKPAVRAYEYRFRITSASTP